MATPKILFFINTQYSSLADQQVAAKLGVPVQFRNAKNIKPTDPAEVCDGVMGSYVPFQYRGKPTAKAVVTAYNESLAKAKAATTAANVANVANAKTKAQADLAAAKAKLAAAEAEVTASETPAATPTVAATTAKVAAK